MMISTLFGLALFEAVVDILMVKVVFMLLGTYNMLWLMKLR